MEEIEKKFLVKEIPNLNDLEFVDIKQFYLHFQPDPIIRLRKVGEEYFLTYKSKINRDSTANVCNEYELPINKTIYEKLYDSKIGNVVAKKRYRIKLPDNHTAELDVFEGLLTGLVVVEVEFESMQDVESFIVPDWFGRDVSHEKRLINSRLSQINNLEDIKEILKWKKQL